MYDEWEVPRFFRGTGRLDSGCGMCTRGLVCRGCTGGRIPPNLFGGCGPQIRCPVCVGRSEALLDHLMRLELDACRDSGKFSRRYLDLQDDLYDARVEGYMRERFPGWE